MLANQNEEKIVREQVFELHFDPLNFRKKMHLK